MKLMRSRLTYRLHASMSLCLFLSIWRLLLSLNFIELGLNADLPHRISIIGPCARLNNPSTTNFSNNKRQWETPKHQSPFRCNACFGRNAQRWLLRNPQSLLLSNPTFPLSPWPLALGADPNPGNHALIFDIVNRGIKTIVITEKTRNKLN